MDILSFIRPKMVLIIHQDFTRIVIFMSLIIQRYVTMMLKLLNFEISLPYLLLIEESYSILHIAINSQ